MPLRIDSGPYHMHQKFAPFDGQLLLNGSLNWTRRASTSNEGSFVVVEQPQLLAAFSREFESLWARYADN